VSSIVDYADVVPSRKSVKAGVICQMRPVISADYGLRTRGYQTFDLVHINAKCVIKDVTEHHLGTARQNCLKVGDVVERRCDHLISSAHARKEKGEVQRCVTRAYRNHKAIFGLEQSSEFRLEQSYGSTHAQPAIFEG